MGGGGLADKFSMCWSCWCSIIYQKNVNYVQVWLIVFASYYKDALLSLSGHHVDSITKTVCKTGKDPSASVMFQVGAAFQFHRSAIEQGLPPFKYLSTPGVSAAMRSE